MNLDSTYRKDFPRFEDSILLSHEKHVTRSQVEEDHLFERRDSKYVPMFLETQNMVDYKYINDDHILRPIFKPKKVPGAKNLFHSKLAPHIHPDDETGPKNSSYNDHFNISNPGYTPYQNPRYSVASSSFDSSIFKQLPKEQEVDKNKNIVESIYK